MGSDSVVVYTLQTERLL